MSFESDLYAALGALVSNRAYPDIAPQGATLPCIVYQQIGGQAFAFLESAMPSKKAALVQIRTWAATRLAANALARSIEDALVESTTLRGEAVGALIADIDIELQRFGTIQDFRFVFND